MAEYLAAVALAVLLATLAGLVQVLRGPRAVDRMLAAMLLGSGGVAVLLLLGEVLGAPALRDVALIFALLAAVTAVTFVRRAWAVLEREGRDGV